MYTLHIHIITLYTHIYYGYDYGYILVNKPEQILGWLCSSRHTYCPASPISLNTTASDRKKFLYPVLNKTSTKRHNAAYTFMYHG